MLPFDDPLVLAGQGAVGAGLLGDANGVETILVAAGGGGLSAGIAAWRPGARVCSPWSLRAPPPSTRVSPPRRRSPSSRARSPTACPRRSPARQRWRLFGAHHAESVLVSEDEIEEAFRWLYQRAKLACEPAAATALAVALRPGWLRSVAVVVSGGNVAPETAAAILARS